MLAGTPSQGIAGLNDDTSLNRLPSSALPSALRLARVSADAYRASPGRASMRISIRALQWLVLAGMAEQTEASVVQKCVGSTGELTFTHSACPDGQPGEPYRAWNPPPGSVAPRPLAKPPSAGSRANREAASQRSAPPPQAARTPAQRPPTQARKSKPKKYIPWRQ